MPRYELALILKAMQRPETAAALRRTVETLMERGAVVRDLENLGERLLPYKMTKHNQRHSTGAYFLVDFYASPSILDGLLDHLHRDVDVVRPAVLKKDERAPNSSCCGPHRSFMLLCSSRHNTVLLPSLTCLGLLAVLLFQ